MIGENYTDITPLSNEPDNKLTNRELVEEVGNITHDLNNPLQSVLSIIGLAGSRNILLSIQEENEKAFAELNSSYKKLTVKKEVLQETASELLNSSNPPDIAQKIVQNMTTEIASIAHMGASKLSEIPDAKHNNYKQLATLSLRQIEYIATAGIINIEPQLEQLEVNTILLDIAKAYSLQLDISLDLTAPQQYLMADKGKLTRVLLNLLNNAQKYARKVGQEDEITKVQISTSLGAEDNYVIAIRDFGRGIPKEYLAKVFQPFFRLPEHQVSSKPGTGRGLDIVQRLVRQHAGQVWAESSVGEGTTFFISLPISPFSELRVK